MSISYDDNNFITYASTLRYRYRHRYGHLQTYICCLRLMSLGMDTQIRVQIPQEVVCVLYSVNIHEERYESTIFPSSIVKLLDSQGFLTLAWQLVKENVYLISNLLKSPHNLSWASSYSFGWVGNIFSYIYVYREREREWEREREQVYKPDYILFWIILQFNNKILDLKKENSQLKN